MHSILSFVLCINNLYLLGIHKSPTFLFFTVFYMVLFLIHTIFSNKVVHCLLLAVYAILLGNTLGLHLFYYGNYIADYLFISIQLFIMILFSIVEIVKEEPSVYPGGSFSLKMGVRAKVEFSDH